MHPKLRTETRPRRSRRALAAPFVFTVALGASACIVQSEPTRTTPPPQQQTAGQPEGGAEGTTPATEPTGAGTTQPTVVTNPPPPTTSGGTATSLPAPPASGGQVKTHADGTCWWYSDPPKCPEGVACNPPRPHQVACK